MRRLGVGAPHRDRGNPGCRGGRSVAAFRGMIRPAAALLLAAAALAFPATASAKTYDVPESLGSALERVAERSGVDVLVPEAIALDFSGRVYAFGGARRNGYTLSLAGDPQCGGATACFLADFSARRGGRPFGPRRVRLAHGIRGRFKPMTCGASCLPPSVAWKRRGVVYTVTAFVDQSADAAQRRALVRAASSAIRRGPR